MQRYKYGQNFQTATIGNFSELIPLAVMECSPGDTLAGKFTASTWTDTCVRPIMNRTYYDTFVFYVPYRLLWSDWIDFITDRTGESALQIPTNSPVNAQFFEYEYDNDNVDTTCNAMVRRAYNLIWNKYFRRQEIAEVDPDLGQIQLTSYRPSTWHESVSFGFDIQDTDIPLDATAETISVDALRQGFAQDRFRKIRDFYGDKYVDYLNALGVQSGWSIAEEPEIIGKKHGDMIFRTTNATTNVGAGPEDNLGDSAGYWQQKTVCKINRTFCPEHGLILMVGTAKMDTWNLSGSGIPLQVKRAQSDYYSPEYQEEQRASFKASTLSINSLIDPTTRKFEELRKASNATGFGVALSDVDSLYFHTFDLDPANPNTYKQLAADNFDSLFTGTLGGGRHYNVHTEVRASRLTPVKPPQQTKGVA